MLGGAVAISTIFFLTLFLLYELPAIGNAILSQIPVKSRPRVRAAAEHVAPSNDDDGVAQVIESLLDSRASPRQD